jgi:N-acetylmuramoyl-L-alanine amidase
MRWNSLFAPALIAISAAAALAQGGGALYERAHDRYFSARDVKSPQIKRNAYLRAAGEMKEFLETHPDHVSAEGARFNLGSIYREMAEENGDREDAGRSLHYFRELLRLHPASRLADDALFGIASVCEKVFKDLRCRQEAIDRIWTDYPSGDMVGLLSGPASSSRPNQAEDRATLRRVSLERLSDGMMVTLELDRGVPITANFLPADSSRDLPRRYYVDLGGAHLPRSLLPPEVPPSLPVSRVRLGQNTLETVRVVLDVSDAVAPERISSWVEGTTVRIRIVGSTPTPLPVERVEGSRSPVDPPGGGEKRLRIVIDAGHGGEDTGARGPKGTLEKDVTLSIARRLEKQFARSPRYEIYMSRTDDRTLSLRDRTDFANRVSGDVFVSIHANAATRKSARGVSTYFLDNADDAESLRVARLENGELAIPGEKDEGTTEEYYLEIMKASMVKNFHTSQSTDLARNVQASLVATLKRSRFDVEDLGVRSAGFFVLTGAKMPAILVETSFLSNAVEEKRLLDPRYQEELSRAVFEGVERFLKAREREHASLYPR